jgi:hypothetical protein
LTRILVGGERTLTPRFAALASHYLVEPCFCRPGVGHDKGGVEARGKAIRLQALVPIPSGATLDAINTALLAQLDAREDRTRGPTPSDANRSERTVWLRSIAPVLILGKAAARVVPERRSAGSRDDEMWDWYDARDRERDRDNGSDRNFGRQRSDLDREAWDVSPRRLWSLPLQPLESYRP